MSERGQGDIVSDEELMKLVVRGDDSAFEQLYNRHKKPVAAYLWRLSGDPELTADAVSETFIRVWRRGKSFRPQKGTFRTWLLAIATNSLRTLWKKQGRVMDSVPYELSDTSGETEEERISAVALRSVLPQLSQEHKQAISLRFFSGCSYQEMAQLQKVPVATARTRVFYALKKLKRLLEVSP